MTLDFRKDYTLENERVLLKPLSEKNFDDLLKFSENESEIWNFSTHFSNAAGRENLVKYIEYAVSSREKETEYPFIVYDKLSGKFAGSTRFYNISDSQKTLEIGYTWYGKHFQGTGLNKNCKYLLLEFAFEKLLMERVGFIADFENKKSIAAMKSLGCKEEGILRSHIFKKDGTRRDSIVLSILKNEWFEDIKPQLNNKII